MQVHGDDGGCPRILKCLVVLFFLVARDTILRRGVDQAREASLAVQLLHLEFGSLHAAHRADVRRLLEQVGHTGAAQLGAHLPAIVLLVEAKHHAAGEHCIRIELQGGRHGIPALGQKVHRQAMHLLGLRRHHQHRRTVGVLPADRQDVLLRVEFEGEVVVQQHGSKFGHARLARRVGWTDAAVLIAVNSPVPSVSMTM